MYHTTYKFRYERRFLTMKDQELDVPSLLINSFDEAMQMAGVSMAVRKNVLEIVKAKLLLERDKTQKLLNKIRHEKS